MVPGLDHLVVTVVAMAATVVVTPLVKRLARAVGAVSYPEARRIHTVPTPVLGGLAMFAGIVAAFFAGSRLDAFSEVFAQTSDPEAVLLAAAIVVLVGVVDDVKGMSALVKLVGQVLAGSLLVLFGMSLLFLYLPGNPPTLINLSPDLSTLLTVAGIVITVNAVNLADGLDGLAAGMVGIGALALLVYVLTAPQTGTSVIATPSAAPLILCALVGVCAGFLVFNSHPASVFMGDTGSMLLGLLLAAAGIAALEVVYLPGESDIAAISAPIFVPLLVLAVPLFDTVWAVGRRVRRGGSVFAPDKGHLHHRLVEIGHSQRRAVLTMYFWSAVFAFAGVGTSVFAPATVGYVLGAALLLGLGWSVFDRRVRRRRRAAPGGEDPDGDSGAAGTGGATADGGPHATVRASSAPR